MVQICQYTVAFSFKTVIGYIIAPTTLFPIFSFFVHLINFVEIKEHQKRGLRYYQCSTPNGRGEEKYLFLAG